MMDMDDVTVERVRRSMESKPVPGDPEWLAEWQWMLQTLVDYGLAEPVYADGEMQAVRLPDA